MTLSLRLHPWKLSIVKAAHCDIGSLAGQFVSYLKTPDECSYVVESAYVPQNVHIRNDGWVCFEVLGPLDFSLTGVLSGIAQALANAEISIFAVSSYDTDFILVKQEKQQQAVAALTMAGYDVRA